MSGLRQTTPQEGIADDQGFRTPVMSHARSLHRLAYRMPEMNKTPKTWCRRLFRYREISVQSNVRYLEALSQVQDPTPAVRDLDASTTDTPTEDGRTVRAFNPLSRNERMLFEELLAGEHTLHGFTNRDVRQKLGLTSYPSHQT